jgi:UDP-3-O-[3-hydroxymyristoyl] glucosamine N-acyltransferase
MVYLNLKPVKYQHLAMCKISKTKKLSDLARMVGGTISKEVDPNITGVAPFETAAPGEITWAATPSFLKRIDQCQATAVIVSRNIETDTKIALKVDHPQVAFAHISRYFNPPSHPYQSIDDTARIGRTTVIEEMTGIGPYAVVGEGAQIGKRSTIYPHTVIGNDVVIGDDVVIYPHVYVGSRCTIGHRVIIHAGTIIGSDGFGFASDGQIYHKIPQLGMVRIDDDVEIGANNTIDRATFGQTWIKEGVKTDNLVHIAHNVVVGAHTVIVAEVGISGSVNIGNHCIIAGQAGISGHLDIGDHATVGPKAGIAKSIEKNQTMSGSPAMPHKTWLKVQRIIPRLPELKKKISDLEKKLNR